MIGIVGCVLLVGACASSGPRRIELDEAFVRDLAPRGVPDARAADPDAARQDLLRARRELGWGRRGTAVAILEDLIAREPRYIPAHRLLQDLLIDSPADWRLRRRYALPGEATDADSAYLAARIEPDRERQAALFAEALAHDPAHPWALVGHALSLLRDDDPEGAEASALVATRVAPDLAMPWLFLGSLHLSVADIERAAAAYRAAVERDPEDVRARLGLVAAARERRDRTAAAESALAALRAAPGDALVLTVAGEALVSAGVPATLREARAILDEAARDVAHPAWVHVLRGRLALAAGDAAGAVSACDAARRAGAGHAEVARVRRRAAVFLGTYVEAVEGFVTSAPPELVRADNLYAARWRALRLAARQADAQPDGSRLLELGEALLAVGWRAEAAVVLARAQAEGPLAVRRRAIRRAAEERAFDRLLGDIAMMARALRSGTLRGEDVAEVPDVLRAIGAASRRRLGRDVTRGAVVRTYPFLGEFAVTVGSEGQFANAFDARGLLLLVGRRRGDGSRIVLGRLAVVRAGERARIAGRDLTFDECWLETDGLPRSLAGLGGGLAGLTMDRLVLLQLDTVLRGPPRVGDITLLPRPATVRAERIALDTPSAVASRLEARIAATSDLEAETLAAVRCHEIGHVYDADRMLPVFAPPWRAVGLVLRHGFDGAAVEAHLEARAALVSLAEGSAPHAALASLLGFLPDLEGETAHARGYVEVVRAMVAEIEDDPASFPSVDRRVNILQQMDRLTPDEARELGRRLLERW
jgi:tetratricopeptide (TPR) repeat protein